MPTELQSFIGLDLGTSAIKGVLVSGKGELLARARRVVDLLRFDQACVEIDPEAHWQSVYGIICELAAQSPAPVAALAMAAAAGNTLLLNVDGSPRTRIISWLDGRETWCPPPKWNVHEVVGWPAIPSFPLAHLHTIHRRHPEVLQGALVGMNNDYLAWRLCGRRALDVSTATPFYLQDQRTFAYHQPFLDAFGLQVDQLPELLPSGTCIGTLLPELVAPGLTSATRIHAGSFDHPAAARALDVMQEDELLISCGTSWVGFYPKAERCISAGELTDPFLAQQGGPWGGIFSVPQIGLRIEAWIGEHFGTGTDRYQTCNAAALAGDTPARRMMLEIIEIFATRLGARRPRRLAMVGGPAEGAAWPTLLAHRLGLPVAVSTFHQDAGAVGAARLAGAPPVPGEYRIFSP